VAVRVDGRVVRRLDVTDGSEKTLLRFAEPGRNEVDVRHQGSPTVAPASVTRAVRVRR
jgi:hypothetical protein